MFGFDLLSPHGSSGAPSTGQVICGVNPAGVAPESVTVEKGALSVKSRRAAGLRPSGADS